MTRSFRLKSNPIHPALVGALNDFDYQREEAKAKSLRGMMGNASFFTQMVLFPVNSASLLLQFIHPTAITPIVVGLNILSLGMFGLQVLLWRIRLPTFHNADVLETARLQLRSLIVEMNSAAPSLQPIFQELEPTIAQGDMVWVTHVYTTLLGYDAKKHHANQVTVEAYNAVVAPAVSVAPVAPSNKLKV